MVKRLTNNLWWKVISFFLAFLLWLTVVNIEDPQVSTTLRGIHVERLNENAITSQKQAIQYVAGDTVDVKLKGRRSLVYKLTNNNIRAYVDMKNISITGSIDIQLDLPNEVELISKTPSSVSVKLEQIIPKQMEIQYEKIGKTKTGYVDLSPIITPSVITIEGAESTIYKVEKVAVPVDINGISGDFTLSVEPQVYDYSGNLVEDVKVSAKLVQVKVPVEKTKLLPILFQPQGEVAKDYAYLGYTLSQENVMVRGQAAQIDAIKEVLVNTVSIADMTSTQTAVVNLAKLLPDGISLNQDKSTVEVEIEIEPIISGEYSFRPEELEIEGLAQEKQLEFVSNAEINANYQGIESKVKALKKEEFKPTIIVENLENGLHTIMVNWQEIEGLTRISAPNFVTVEISNKESATEPETGSGQANE